MRGLDRITVLVADAAEESRSRLRGDLEELGYDVVTAKTSCEALALARHHRPTFIMAELMMPDLSGTKLCQVVSDDQVLYDIPVVLMSSSCAASRARQMVGEGAVDALVRPYDVDELAHRLAVVVRLRCATDAVRRLQRNNAALRAVLGHGAMDLVATTAASEPPPSQLH